MGRIPPIFPGPVASSDGYRPPQWNQALGIATVMLIFPGQSSTPQYSSAGIGATLPNTQTRYIFDAVLRTGHEQRLTKTKHPVQTGSNISDHAYIEPARVSLDIACSDAVAMFTPGMWSGGPTKSVSVYQTLLAMQYSRVPLVLTTKYRTYQNLVITMLSADDTYKTFASFKGRVEFEELFVATTQDVPNSARPQTTQTTQAGAVTTQPPSGSVTSQYQVTPAKMITIPSASGLPQVSEGPMMQVDGAGNWTSVPNQIIYPAQ